MKIAILTMDSREHFRDYANPVPYFGTAPEALLQGFIGLPETEVHVVSCLRQPVNAPEKIADNIWYHALHVPKIGWMRTLFQGCIRATRKKLCEIQPDIVHGQGTEGNNALCAVFSEFPNVITIHGNMQAIAKLYQTGVGGLYCFVAAKLETFALKRTDGVFCNSAHTESLVAPRTKCVWRVPNPVRAEFLESPSVRLRTNGNPILLNVGVLTPNKRQMEILGLARKLWQRGLKFEMQFIGAVNSKSKYGSDFLRQLAEAEKAGYARHLGTLSADKLIAAMDAASALVHTPMEESFGLVVAEALARNLKFFGTRTGGIMDIATDVEGAELFPMDDWTGLENSIARWIGADCPRPQSANEIMRLRYSPEIIARRHLEIYQEVLGKHF